MEWLTLLNTSRTHKISGLVALIFIFIIVAMEASQNLSGFIIFRLLFWFLSSVVFNKFQFSKRMVGLSAFIMCLASVIALYYASTEGLMFLLSTLALVWIIDTGAYFAGKILVIENCSNG